MDTAAQLVGFMTLKRLKSAFMVCLPPPLFVARPEVEFKDASEVSGNGMENGFTGWEHFVARKTF
uniref:Uncharacterized protein n=1 Tax=Salix viminalis TaxID=40686 RepID=A0A6N2LQH5_SALVM